MKLLRVISSRLSHRFSIGNSVSLPSSKTSLRFLSAVTHRDLEFSNIVELQQNAFKEYKEKKLFGTRVPGGFDWISYGEFNKQVQLFRNVLVHHKIGRNDKVAMISNNRVEWAVAMYAVAGLGAQLVPMYEAQLERDWRYIIEDSGAKLLLVGPETIYDRTKDYVGSVGDLQSILCFDSSPEYLHGYKRWMELVKSEPPVEPVSVSNKDLYVLIYTSGTTGNPKGVCLSHENVCHVLRGLQKLWKHEADDHVTMAFLPWAHVFGQSTELHAMMAAGNAMGIIANREQIVESIPMLRPTVIISVPTLFNKVYDGVMKKISEESPLKQKIFFGALKIARKRNEALEFGKEVSPLLAFQHRLADKVVFSKIRERLGGRLRYFASGGAATSLVVLQFFEDIGLPICEGYGLTETAPVMTSSCTGWDKRRLGCVGVPLEGVDLRIMDPGTLEEVPHGQDGEVCCSSPSVMVGYHNNPKANEEVFFYKDGKRFFRTGDLGRIVDDKFLKITGRIKEQFKLENGKYVVPAPLEDMVCRSAFISQAFLFGDNKPFVMALIVPEHSELNNWAKKNLGHQAPPDGSLDALMSHPAVVDLMSNEIMSSCAGMKSYEKPRKWIYTTEPFTQENQMLTPKMSLRRNHILKAYADRIAEGYTDGKGVTLKRTSKTIDDY